MSAAFDTINRRHLLEIVKSIVDEDEHRLIQFLLSGTVIDTGLMVLLHQNHSQAM